MSQVDVGESNLSMRKEKTLCDDDKEAEVKGDN